MVLSRRRRHAFRLRRSKLRRQGASPPAPPVAKLPNSLSPARPSDPAPTSSWDPPTALARRGGTWESDADPLGPASSADQDHEPGAASPTAQLLALFADPRIAELDAAYAARQLDMPIQDVRNMLSALSQAGYLHRRGDLNNQYALAPDKKAELEHLYRQTVRDMVADGQIAIPTPAGPVAPLPGSPQEDDPRMPMTAGVLSLFLPGTGQLLNGDIGRAVLVFAIWALAILAPHPAIIIFVRLYAGAEAFFNAKLRRLAQRRALEAAAAQGGGSLGPAGTPALPASSGQA